MAYLWKFHNAFSLHVEQDTWNLLASSYTVATYSTHITNTLMKKEMKYCRKQFILPYIWNHIAHMEEFAQPGFPDVNEVQAQNYKRRVKRVTLFKIRFDSCSLKKLQRSQLKLIYGRNFQVIIFYTSLYCILSPSELVEECFTNVSFFQLSQEAIT